MQTGSMEIGGQMKCFLGPFKEHPFFLLEKGGKSPIFIFCHSQKFPSSRVLFSTVDSVISTCANVCHNL